MATWPNVVDKVAEVGPATLKAAAATGLFTLPKPPDIVYWTLMFRELPGDTQ